MMLLKFTFILTLLWLPNILINWGDLNNFFAWRYQLIMFSGFLTLSYMVLAVVLAARFSWIEEKVKGLDKSYQLHKHLGIAAAIVVTLHWIFSGSAGWLIEAGVLERPNRAPRPEIDGVNWHLIAEVVGEKAFYILVIITIISLVHAISYKTFKFTHKIMGVVMLAGIFHALLFLKWNVAFIPMNLTVIGLSIYGVWCSWLSLSGKIGKQKKVIGEITEVETFSTDTNNNKVVRFSIQLVSSISYQNGQFAYLDFHDKEYPHPFSILNYDSQNKLIEFGVKDLGDYTHKMVSGLKVGQKVTVEGGYGRFQTSDFAEQVWVGAGIGIVPFISRLYDLQQNISPNLKKVQLFYCVNTEQEAFFENEIQRIVQHLSCIELHLLVAERGALLDAPQIMQYMRDKDFDVSFCGPEVFASALRTGLTDAGISPQRFHSELFKMR